MKGSIVTVKQLSECLKSLNLPHTGKKDVLIERLGWAELGNIENGLFENNTFSQNCEPKFPTTGPTIKRIPKASRIQACKTFTEIINDITRTNENKYWEKLLQYPRFCLGSTARGGKNKKSQATLINSKIEAFAKGNVVLEKHKQRNSQPSLKDQVASKLSMGDVSGAIRVISSSDTVLPPSFFSKS